MSRAPILQTENLTARFGDRILFKDLNMCLDTEKVALIGRNGAGKSTLLGLLSGEFSARQGRMARRGEVKLVSQILPGGEGSPGERRRELLRQALDSGSHLLLLDEPTQDLDQHSVDWLRGRLQKWSGGLLVATHDRRLLNDFHHFFVIEESGCRYLSGDFRQLESELEAEYRRQEESYLKRLSRLADTEEKTLKIARRRRRKQQYGRSRELDRATPRSRLNKKRDSAQVSHGRINRVRDQRLKEAREWTRIGRRSLKVELPLALQMPELPEDNGVPALEAEHLSVGRNGRVLVRDLSLNLGRRRVAVVGPNGSGKTTLLQTLVGERKCEFGSVRVDRSRVGVIEQGAANWLLDRSLVDYLGEHLAMEEIASRLMAQKFPLALAQRPLRSLSPGERVRAVLIGLVARRPAVEVLVLDEPTYCLDILGQKALGEALREWPGGLVVAGHNRDFLEAVGFERVLELGCQGLVV